MNTNKVSFEYVSTSALIPYARNSRLHSEKQVAQIAASIREFGFLSPVVVDKNNTIVAGHGRVMAAQKLGLEQVPCVKAEHLSDNQMKAYVLVDNRLSETSEWDKELLKLELETIEDIALDDMGFCEKELNDILEINKETVEQQPEEIESKIKEEFMLIVILKNESEQASLYESLTTQGIEVKIP